MDKRLLTSQIALPIGLWTGFPIADSWDLETSSLDEDGTSFAAVYSLFHSKKDGT